MADENTTRIGPIDAGSERASSPPLARTEAGLEQGGAQLPEQSPPASATPPEISSAPEPQKGNPEVTPSAPESMGHRGDLPAQAGTSLPASRSFGAGGREEPPQGNAITPAAQKEVALAPPAPFASEGGGSAISFPARGGSAFGGGGQALPKKMDDEMTRLLAEVKLPERRAEAPGQNLPEIAPKSFDTVPAGSESTPSAVPGNAAVSPDVKPEPHEQASEIPQEAPQDKSSLSSVHTLKSDVQSIVREKKISVVRAAAFEQERRSRKIHSESPVPGAEGHKRKVLFLVSAIILLLTLGSAALFFVYSRTQEEKLAASPADTSLIFAERTIVFPIDKLSDIDIKRSLSQARSVTGALGSVARVVPTAAETSESTPSAESAESSAGEERPVAIGKFLKAINAGATPELARALRGDFFFGIHTADKNAPFLIIPVVSYERAFAGMLSWERNLNSDMTPIFTAVPAQVTDENGLSVENRFQDVVISNYDVRALLDDSGTIQMLYSFPTRNILIIAENPLSFIEMLSRLRANRQL